MSNTAAPSSYAPNPQQALPPSAPEVRSVQSSEKCRHFPLSTAAAEAPPCDLNPQQAIPPSVPMSDTTLKAAEAAAPSYPPNPPQQVRPPSVQDSFLRRIDMCRTIIDRLTLFCTLCVAVVRSIQGFYLIGMIIANANSIHKPCDVPLKLYFWLEITLTLLRTFSGRILRWAYWNGCNLEDGPNLLRGVLVVLAFHAYSLFVLHMEIGFVSRHFGHDWDEVACRQTAPELYEWSVVYALFSVVIWLTLAVYVSVVLGCLCLLDCSNWIGIDAWLNWIDAWFNWIDDCHNSGSDGLLMEEGLGNSDIRISSFMQ